MIYILYLFSILMGGVGAWLISEFAPRLELMDSPDTRSSHVNLTPKGGGIGILAAFLSVCLFIGIPFVFWVPISIISLLGLYGDRTELSPKVRLFTQFSVAIIIILGTKNPLSHYLLLIMAPLWVVFIVGTANFYNFMDGINGIAGITGIVGFGLLAFYASLSGIESSFVTLSISLSLCCLGFLPFNMPKAKVFMGDVGSILLGFAFAGMVVWLSKSLLDFICLAAFLFPFYADELTTMVVRIKDGENLLRAHRRHLYQLLANEKGVSQWKVSLGYGLLQLVVGVTVLLLNPFGSIMILSILIVYFIAFTMVSYFIRKNLVTT